MAPKNKKVNGDEGSSPQNLELPKEITIRWLFEHVPLSLWFTFAGILISLVLSAFALGIYTAQFPGIINYLRLLPGCKEKLIVTAADGDGKNDKTVFNSYYLAMDGKEEYLSSKGSLEVKEATDKLLIGATTVYDVMVNGKIDETTTWNVAAYKTDNGLYLSYNTGVAVLKHTNDDYVGYWIGEDASTRAFMICPYVLSKYKISGEDAKARWSVFGNKCLQWPLLRKQNDGT